MKHIICSILISSVLLSACSPIVNTVNGLTTFRSTISGSNYPFSVDPRDGSLQTEYSDIDAKSLISKKESFEIALDSLFLRYLQASEPYVMIYSEAWMGSDVMPLDKKKQQRQIVLIKDGLSFNARLPFTSIPILGPVTMGEDSLDVHISLYVVVLSKDDNRQTVDFLNGVAAVASTAAPQYALIAGAAAEVGKTIVAQNRDKIEFEHTFNLSPIHTIDGVFNHKKEFGPSLAEGKLVVIKGENEDRLVPYQNWFYYISPFNWLGHPPEESSIRFETSSNNSKAIITLPHNFNPYDENANYTLINAPFNLLSFLLIPDNSIATKLFKNPAVSPDEIFVCGNYLQIIPKNKTCIADENENFIQRLYHDKTYAILSVRRTAGSYGNFNDLFSSFEKAGYGNQIDNLITTRDQSLTQSQDATKKAIESVSVAIAFERAKKQLSKLANQGLSGNKTVEDIFAENKNITTEEDKNRLKNIYWEELTLESAKRLKSKVSSLIDTKSPISPPSPQNFCEKFKIQVAHEQNYWRILDNSSDKPDATSSNRDIAWNSILLGLSNYLSDTDNSKKYAQVITDNFDALKINDLSSPNSLPVIDCSKQPANS